MTTEDTKPDFDAIAAGVTERLTTEESAATETPSEPEPEAPVAEVEPEAPVAEAAPDPDIFDDEGVQSFDRGYVTKLRDARERYRTQLREEQERWGEWNETLKGWSDEERTLARDLLGAIREGDLAKATQIIGPDALAEHLRVAAQPEEQPEAGGEGEKPLTRAEMEAFYAEREARQEQQKATDAVFAEARELGYVPDAKPGTPDFARWVMLVQHAQQTGDLSKAHEQMQKAEEEQRQKIIEEFVASKENGSPAPAPGAGAASREPDDAWLEKSGMNPIEAAKRRALGNLGTRQQVG